MQKKLKRIHKKLLQLAAKTHTSKETLEKIKATDIEIAQSPKQDISSLLDTVEFNLHPIEDLLNTVEQQLKDLNNDQKHLPKQKEE